MFKRYALMLASLVLFATAAAQAKPIHIPRTPDYHNGKIVFGYLGSIWVVNEDGSNPRRLTVHSAHDEFPRFSPDGKWIAFSSDRYGNNDVFVIPAEGGEAKQLTFNSSPDTVVGWARDSKNVIFTSNRDGAGFPGVAMLHQVSIDGGLETVIPTDAGYWGSYSMDGTKFAFNRHVPIWWRKHYRGSGATDLWVMDVKAKTYKRILDTEVDDQMKPYNSWPQYASNGTIYFVSDRDVMAKAGDPKVWKSTYNIYKIADTGGAPTQVTHFTDGSLFFPSISSDGKVIVFEENFGLWKLDVASGRTSEVKVDISADDKTNNFRVLTVNGETDSYDLSPSTLRAAITTHGEIFTVATDRGDVTRVTNSYFRDTDPAWSPDGKWIAYVSDQTGRPEVWVAGTDGMGAKKLSDLDSEKLTLNWMPDSKSVLYTTSDHKLNSVNVETGQTRTLATNDSSGVSGVTVSPDGAWIAYNKADHDFRQHIYFQASAGGEEHRLKDDLQYASYDGRFTADGKKLIFLGGYVQAGSATLRTNVASIYSVTLAKEDTDSMSRDVDTEEQARAMMGAGRGGRGGGGAAAAPPETKIDFEGMDRRITQITHLTENISTAVPSPDSRSYAFVAAVDVDGRSVPTLYVIQADGSALRRLSQAAPPAAEDENAPPAAAGMGGGGISSLQFSRDGATLYFLERNGIWAVRTAGAAGGAAAGPGGGGAAAAGGEGGGGRRRVNFTVRVEVDEHAERKQIFEEAWRTLKYRFYDAKMNNVDWEHYKHVYEALLDDVGDRQELQNVTLQMIGELNASHTGMSGGGDPNRDALQTRYPGFEIAADSSGFYKVTTIYKNGPADHDYVKISQGNYIIAVNGMPLHSGDNYWKYYSMAPGRKFEFMVNSRPAADGAWSVRITPVNAGANTTLQYEKWVADRTAMVEKMSNGEIGYLHIRAMNAPSLAKFERDLADNHFKKALIIDQRFNGGGGIDQELLEILEQHQYQYTRGRDSTYVTRPERAFFGPIVVMQNERSFSDAEVFPDGIKTLGLGKLVGTNTNSSVIGTGAYRLIDNEMVRTPGTGLWNIDGHNLENYGVPTDFWVDNTPPDDMAGRDAQLEKAVEVLKAELAKNPPKMVPGRQ
ncbi:MAG: S41 family peptidase [Candidatus Acidiferrales bacterium]